MRFVLMSTVSMQSALLCSMKPIPPMSSAIRATANNSGGIRRCLLYCAGLNFMTTEPRTATRVHLATAFLALGALWFILCRQLSGEWWVNEQYTYGWFVPFFAAFLFWP